MTTKRRVVACFSDLHAGHKVGLANPDTVLWDEGPTGEPVARSVSLGAVQLYLWELYKAHIEQVRQFADGDEVILIHNGDLTQGTFYRDGLNSNELDDHIQIGYYNLLPWLELPNVRTIRLILGTGVHTFNGSSEAIVARLLRATHQDRNIKAISHGLLNVDGVTFDIAHHGPGCGIRLWTEGNQLRYYLRSLMLQELLAGRQPPALVLRAHYHNYIPPETVRIATDGRMVESTICLTSSYCGITGYGRKATRSGHIQNNGMVMAEVVDGRLGQMVPMVKTLDLRTRETL